MKKSRFKEIVKEVLVEDNEYQIFFQKCLSKAGKSIPEMSTQEKKAFFNKIDATWKGRGEKSEGLVGNQHKLDVDGDGEIEASDLKQLRSSKNESKLNEGAEWILLNSIQKVIDSYRGDLMPKNDPFGDDISPNEKEWKALYKKASSKDKKTMDAILSGMNESLNEDAKKVWKKGKGLFVDSDFVNFSKGKLPNSELKHAGMGDFFLDTPNGKVYFIRTSEKFDGMSGRAHRITDNEQNGKLVALLIKKMNAKIVNESVNESFGKLIPKVGTIDDFKLKDLLSKNKSVLDILGNSEKSFMTRDNVDVIGVSGKNYDFIFTDGKQEFEIGGKPRTLKRPLRKARPQIVKHYSTNESKSPLNEDKLSDFEKLLKSHDWYYDRSDDHSKWKRGSQQRKDLVDLKTQLGKEGKQKEAESLWSKYKKG